MPARTLVRLPPMQCTTDPLGFPRKMRSGFKNWEDARFVTVVEQVLRRQNCLANTMFSLWLEYACTIVHIYQTPRAKTVTKNIWRQYCVETPPRQQIWSHSGPRRNLEIGSRCEPRNTRCRLTLANIQLWGILIVTSQNIKCQGKSCI